MNYQILVNKDNPIDDNFIDDVTLVETLDAFQNIELVEQKTYKKFKELRDFLKTLGINIELDSAYRSIEKQQKIIDDFTKKYGLDYVKKYVAPIKTSEHHTGLAIDITLVIEGKILTENEELMKQKRVFETIHQHLNKYGFILRYPIGKESITGYNYEPWHIRFVGVEVANYIYNNGLTLEEYIEKSKEI